MIGDGTESLKSYHKMGVWAKLAENLHASSFTEGLPVDSTKREIHFDEQYF
jgi:hypothetical protein